MGDAMVMHKGTGIKRALVVDDSKVARSVLARMLEKHGVAVDTSESAEAAIDYLLTHKPDVIFLDHIMPGMDGFQAMQVIKQNPQTATIPIMMYTSKEGEMYLSQARALGAVGCLPKQVKPAEVTEVLERLGRMRLHSQLAQEHALAQRAVNDDVAEPLDAVEEARAEALRERVEDALRPAENEAVQVAMRRYLDEHRVLIKEDIESGIEKATRSVVDELKVDEDVATAVPPAAVRQYATAKARIGAGRYMLMLAVLVLPSLVLMKLYFDADAARDTLARQYQRLVERQETLQASMQRNRSQQDTLGERYEAALESLAELQARTQQERTQLLDMVTWAINDQAMLDYGQNALGNETLARIRALLERLDKLGIAGTVQIRRHHGRFCLSGNDTTGFSRPVDNLPLGECNIAQSTVTAPDPATLERALNNELTARGGKLRIQVTDLGYEQPREPYPQPSAVQTAGEWNRVAQRNNRLEIAIVADAGSSAALPEGQSAQVEIQTY